jgi:hypothetical protein
MSRIARKHLGAISGVAPPPADSEEVISLLHFDGAHLSTSFTDEVVTNTWVRNGTDAADLFISNSQSKFGGTAARTQPGTGQCDLRPVDPTPFLLGFGPDAVDFETDMWIRRTSSTSWSEYIMSWQPSVAAGPYLSIGGTNSTYVGKVRFSGTTGSVTGTTVLALNQWYHVLVNRYGGLMRIFIDGVLDASGTMTTTNSNQFCLFGSYYSQGRLRAYVDEFRFVREPLERSANFTPPILAYTYP